MFKSFKPFKQFKTSLGLNEFKQNRLAGEDVNDWNNWNH